MLTLEKSIKVLKLNRKPTGKWSKLKEGDVITVKFDVTGSGGNSPTVDIYINGSYNHSPFARSFNEMFYKGKREYVDGYGWTTTRPLAEIEEVN